MAQFTDRFETTREVTSYFDGKGLKPGFSWLDVFAQEPAYNFTVAKAVELELLTSFRNVTSTAITGGYGFDTWRKDMAAELQRLGWYGPRMVSDPSGVDPDRMVDFSSDRRLRTIFWSNMNSARAAGQWERAQRTKRGLPYILYVRTTSGDPRVEHLAWVGLILPVDHPFWKTHWPPNGWMCKCQVRQISAREAERLLGTSRVVGKDPDGNDITISYTDQVPDLGPDRDFRNRRTGEIVKIPPGIDPGWQTNPGLARASTLVQNFEDKLAVAHVDDATKVLKELWDDPYLRIAPKLPEAVWLPAGHNAALAAEIGATSPVISITSEALADHIGRGTSTVEDLTVLPELLSKGEIASDQSGTGSTRSLLWRAGRSLWRTLVSLSRNGTMRASDLTRIDAP